MNRQLNVQTKWLALGATLLFVLGISIGSEIPRGKSAATVSADTPAIPLTPSAEAEREKSSGSCAQLSSYYQQSSAAVQTLTQIVQRQKQQIADLEAQLQRQQSSTSVPLPGAVAQPTGYTPDPRMATVLYESSRASVNVSLLPLPGAPRISIGPSSQLAPRWVIAGRVEPRMVGDTRQAIYYYFDATSSLWQGPYAPLRVTQ